MKKIAIIGCVLFTISISAQNNEKELIEKTAKAAKEIQDTTKKEGWFKAGNVMFLFNQSAFNAEWRQGGVSNFAGNLSINYDFNYKKADWVWDNKIFGAYGITKIKGTKGTNKSDDRIEFTSLLGKRATNNWYYTAFFNLRTQFDVGLDKSTNRISQLFSPAYIQVGPGFMWKKSDNLKVNIAPATSRLIIVDEKFTRLTPSFGVKQFETTRFEFGAALNAYYKFTLIENVSVENILNLYSNYLDKPKNIDIDYQMNLVMKVNKYLSANLAFQTIYDDNAVKAVQVKQVFGLGVNYGF